MAEFIHRSFSDAQAGGNLFNSALFISGTMAQSSTTIREMKQPEYMRGFRFQASRAELGIHSASYVDAIALQGCDSVK